MLFWNISRVKIFVFSKTWGLLGLPAQGTESISVVTVGHPHASAKLSLSDQVCVRSLQVMVVMC